MLCKKQPYNKNDNKKKTIKRLRVDRGIKNRHLKK